MGEAPGRGGAGLVGCATQINHPYCTQGGLRQKKKANSTMRNARFPQLHAGWIHLCCYCRHQNTEGLIKKEIKGIQCFRIAF